MRRCRQHPREAGKPHNRPRSPRSRTCYPGTIRRRSASGVSVLVSIWWATRARVARRWREQYDAESGASRQTTSDHPVGADRGIVKLRLTAVSDPQHGGFTAGSSPVSLGSIDELFVNLTVPSTAMKVLLWTELVLCVSPDCGGASRPVLRVRCERSRLTSARATNAACGVARAQRTAREALGSAPTRRDTY